MILSDTIDIKTEIKYMFHNNMANYCHIPKTVFSRVIHTYIHTYLIVFLDEAFRDKFTRNYNNCH